MKLETYSGESLEVSDSTFGRAFNEPLVHQVVQTFLANGKTGTRKQKTRSEVRGGGSKPWRQKGTGRARAGTRNSPIWVGGGVTFAARPLTGELKVNRKMYTAAVRSILSELIRQNRLVVVDTFVLSEPKTKQLIAKLSKLALDNVLIVVESLEENLHLAARNLKKVQVQDIQGVNPVNLIAQEKVLVTVDALRKLEEMFG